jgi:hypothetical protein
VELFVAPLGWIRNPVLHRSMDFKRGRRLIQAWLICGNPRKRLILLIVFFWLDRA